MAKGGGGYGVRESRQKDRGQMAMRGEREMMKKDGWRGEAVGRHVQLAATGAHGNKMEITAGFNLSNRTDILFCFVLSRDVIFFPD